MPSLPRLRSLPKPIAEEMSGVLPDGSPSAMVSMFSPFASADLQAPADELIAGAYGYGVDLDGAPSMTSTIFYQGTPRAAALRKRRTLWLRERALGRTFVKGERAGWLTPWLGGSETCACGGSSEGLVRRVWRSGGRQAGGPSAWLTHACPALPLWLLQCAAWAQTCRPASERWPSW